MLRGDSAASQTARDPNRHACHREILLVNQGLRNHQFFRAVESKRSSHNIFRSFPSATINPTFQISDITVDFQNCWKKWGLDLPVLTCWVSEKVLFFWSSPLILHSLIYTKIGWYVLRRQNPQIPNQTPWILSEYPVSFLIMLRKAISGVQTKPILIDVL